MKASLNSTGSERLTQIIMLDSKLLGRPTVQREKSHLSPNALPLIHSVQQASQEILLFNFRFKRCMSNSLNCPLNPASNEISCQITAV